MTMQLKGKKAALVGMGRSSCGAARLLLREGATPFVTDAAESETLEGYPEELDGLRVAYETGGHTARAFADADLVVLSPGVPPSLPPIEKARAAGVPVVGELELAARFCQSRILALTGTNGKTTTTTLLRDMVAAAGHTVALAGNNDLPLSLAILDEPQPDFVVVEVSSYQLETVDRFRPWIGAVLNLTPDHLGRHGTMEQYAAAKEGLFARQGPGDIAVLNAGDSWTRAMVAPEGVARRFFSLDGPVDGGLWCDGEAIREGDEVLCRRADVPLPGRHNLENALAALTMFRAAGLDWARGMAGLQRFKGVEHRIEFVTRADGTAYYNDSKSTNVDSLRVALESFDAPVVLIAGGRGKGADYGVLADLVARRVKHLVCIGEDGPKLARAFGGMVSTEHADTMASAVAQAAAAAQGGGTVLLSPGCASFDWYRNFEERGRDFKDCVRRLVGAAAQGEVSGS